MLKPSKFNYLMYNDKNELLMFNTFSGCKSKALPEQAKYFEDLLNKPEIIESNALTEHLTESGMLVKANVNEVLKVEAAFYDLQSQSILTLYILPTEQCNFNCIYCNEKFERGKMNEEIQEGIISFIRRNITSYTGVKVFWFGGEPLLEMDVISRLSVRIKEICKKAKRSYSAHITTNGYLLSYDSFCELLKNNVFVYQVTLDGFKESHDSLRPLANKEPTYDTIIHNLTEIKKKSKSGKFIINLRANFTKKMTPSIPHFLDWYNNVFDCDPRFCLYISIVANLDGAKVEELNDIVIKRREDEIAFYGMIYESAIKKINFANHQHLRLGGCICIFGIKNAFLIDAEGNIRKCSCHLSDDKQNKLGKFLNTGAMVFDADIHMNWFVSQKSDKCKECTLLPICMGHSCPYYYVVKGIPKCPPIDLDFMLKIMDRQGYFELISY